MSHPHAERLAFAQERQDVERELRAAGLTRKEAEREGSRRYLPHHRRFAMAEGFPEVPLGLLAGVLAIIVLALVGAVAIVRWAFF